jgi:hypothetical protein
MKRPIETKCKVCGTKMVVEADPIGEPWSEVFFKCITCDTCLVKMGRMKLKQTKLQPPRELRSATNDP